TQEDDDGGKLHPDEEANGSRESAVNQTVVYLADVKTEADISNPPEKGSHHGAGKNRAEAGFLWPGDSIDDGQRDHRQNDGNTMEEEGPEGHERRGPAQLMAKPLTQGAPEDPQERCSQQRCDGHQQQRDGA